jgi:hypothetical protein
MNYRGVVPPVGSLTRYSSGFRSVTSAERARAQKPACARITAVDDHGKE